MCHIHHLLVIGMFSRCIFHAVSFCLSLPNSLLHSQHHGTQPPVHFCCSYYFFMFSFYLPLFLPLSLPLSLSPSLPRSLPPSLSLSLSLPPSLPPSLSLSLSPSLTLSLSVSLSLCLSLSPFLSIYVSLWLQDTCHMMPFTKQHSAYAWVVTCILFLINLTFHNLSLHSSYKIHQPFTDYYLRLPYSELLEKRLFCSRANRRLVDNFQLQIKLSLQLQIKLLFFRSRYNFQLQIMLHPHHFEMQIELSLQSCALFVDDFPRSSPTTAETETLLRRREPRVRERFHP